MRKRSAAMRVVLAGMVSATLMVAGASASTLPVSGGPFRVEFEGGAAWQSRNDIRIPNDDSATEFSLTDLGDGPYAAFRTRLGWDIGGRHGVELLLAPLTLEDEGSFAEDVRFQGETYRAGEPVDSLFRFNSYRLIYRYRAVESEKGSLHVGAAANIRDAKVRLEQGDISSEDENLGVVPLLHLDGDYRLGGAWSAVLNADFLAAPQGRAIDTALLLRYSSRGGWDVAAGYRTLEGGADNDSVYTFSWLHYAVLSVGYAFGP
jgi:hypothetical protein